MKYFVPNYCAPIRLGFLVALIKCYVLPEVHDFGTRIQPLVTQLLLPLILRRVRSL